VTGRDLHTFHCQAKQNQDFRFFLWRSWQMVFSPDSRLIAIGDARRSQPTLKWLNANLPPMCVYVYELETGRLIQTLTGMNGAVTALCFSPDGGTLAVGEADDRGEIMGENAAVLLWEMQTWKSLGATAVRPQSAITRMQFSPDGKTLATLAENAISIEFWSVPRP
jgi:WD40 repeat protein